MNELEKIVVPLLKWYKENARELPWRKDNNPYKVWISEIMLQQTRVETVIPYFIRFMEKYPTIETLAKANEEELLKIWEGLGYYSRVRNIFQAAQIIVEERKGVFPKNRTEIQKLPGIGQYTSGAIASIAFGESVAAVDGNVMRVYARLTENYTDVKNEKFKNQVAKIFEEIYPEKNPGDFTQALMELGALVCVPREPRCDLCPIKYLCRAKRNGEEKLLPVIKKAAERKKIKITIFILESDKKYALSKRREQGLLKGMWEFPNEEKHLSETEIKKWITSNGLVEEKIVDFGMKKHIFTHVVWEMQVYYIHVRNQISKYTWKDREKIHIEIPIPTAFKKIYDDIQSGQW